MKFKPHSYQEEVISHILKHPFAGLFLTMGLGKTASVLEAFHRLKQKGKVDKLFIIAPLRVCYMVWPYEVAKWDYPYSVLVMHDNNRKTHIDSDIVIINPAGLPWLVDRMLNKKWTFKHHKWMLIVDESSQFKNASSKRFRIMKKLIKAFQRRVILTGSPTPNGLQQLWSQIYLLDEGERLGKYITRFRERYFDKTGYMGYQLVPKKNTPQELQTKIQDIVIHKSADELSLPPVSYNTLSFALDKKNHQIYQEMKTELVAQIKEDETAIAVNAAVAVNKLKQISNGGIYVEEGAYQFLHNFKTDIVEEMTESLSGRPLLIAYEYKHDRIRLENRFDNIAIIDGETRSDELKTTLEAWNSNEISRLAIQIQSASHGLNLQYSDCADVVWYSIPYDLELYDQFNARVYRQGVKHHITIHHLVGLGLIDEQILKLLRQKGSVQEKLLKALEI